MRKGIFAHRKLNSNLVTNKPETNINDSVDRLSLSVESPWYKQNVNLCQVNAIATKDDLWVEKMQSSDSDGIEYFLKMNDDHERLTQKVDCVPNELAHFINNELKIADDKNNLMQRELLQKFENLKDDVSMVS